MSKSNTCADTAFLDKVWDAADVRRRQTMSKTLTKLERKCHNLWIWWPFLESPWEMHSDKYKYGKYWFGNLWNFENFEKTKTILHSKTKNGRVLSVNTSWWSKASYRQASHICWSGQPWFCVLQKGPVNVCRKWRR